MVYFSEDEDLKKVHENFVAKLQNYDDDLFTVLKLQNVKVFVPFIAKLLKELNKKKKRY